MAWALFLAHCRCRSPFLLIESVLKGCDSLIHAFPLKVVQAFNVCSIYLVAMWQKCYPPKKKKHKTQYTIVYLRICRIFTGSFDTYTINVRS